MHKILIETTEPTFAHDSNGTAVFKGVSRVKKLEPRHKIVEMTQLLDDCREIRDTCRDRDYLMVDLSTLRKMFKTLESIEGGK